MKGTQYGEGRVFKIVQFVSDRMFISLSLTHLHSNCVQYRFNDIAEAPPRTGGLFVYETLEAAKAEIEYLNKPMCARVIECKYTYPMTEIFFRVVPKSKFIFKDSDEALDALVTGRNPYNDRRLIKSGSPAPAFVVPSLLPVRRVRF